MLPPWIIEEQTRRRRQREERGRPDLRIEPPDREREPEPQSPRNAVVIDFS